MTNVPANLLAVRNLLLTHLNRDRSAVRANDLEPAEVGIVGDASHRGGYHCGSDRTVSNDYSVVESSRDRGGLTLNASALDVGGFSVTTRTGTHNLRTFSRWMVAQCAAGARDTRDIREIIYSPDGVTVKRWDRLGKRRTGDSSHLSHTHFSFFRDSTKGNWDQTPLFRRYLSAIGLLEDDMPTVEEIFAHKIQNDFTGAEVSFETFLRSYNNSLVRIEAAEKIILARLDGIDPDEEVIAQFVLAGLTPEKIVAAIPPHFAQQVVDNLSARLASGGAVQ